MDKFDAWIEEYKHLQGKHNQKKHGNRGAATVGQSAQRQTAGGSGTQIPMGKVSHAAEADVETSAKKFGNDPNVHPIVRASFDITAGKLQQKKSPEAAWKIAQSAAKAAGLQGKIDADPKNPQVPDWQKLQKRVASTYDIKSKGRELAAAEREVRRSKKRMDDLSNASESRDIKDFDIKYAALEKQYKQNADIASNLQGQIEVYYELLD